MYTGMSNWTIQGFYGPSNVYVHQFLSQVDQQHPPPYTHPPGVMGLVLDSGTKVVYTLPKYVSFGLRNKSRIASQKVGKVKTQWSTDTCPPPHTHTQIRLCQYWTQKQSWTVGQSPLSQKNMGLSDFVSFGPGNKSWKGQNSPTPLIWNFEIRYCQFWIQGKNGKVGQTSPSLKNMEHHPTKIWKCAGTILSPTSRALPSSTDTSLSKQTGDLYPKHTVQNINLVPHISSKDSGCVYYSLLMYTPSACHQRLH